MLARAALVCAAIACSSVQAAAPRATAAAAPSVQDPRIVGGEVVQSISQYPFIVSLQTKEGAHRCGGSILSKFVVITAGHCGFQFDPTTLQVVVGRLDLTDNTKGVVLSVSRILVHPDYDAGSVANDVSLYFLGGRGIPDSWLAPVALNAAGGPELDGAPLWVAGWGLISESGPLSPALRHVQVQTIARKSCSSAYSLVSSMMCAGVPEGGKDSCQGDSGGPLVAVSSSGKKVLVGLVSTGSGCARAGFPGIYTSIRSVRRWISVNARLGLSPLPTVNARIDAFATRRALPWGTPTRPGSVFATIGCKLEPMEPLPDLLPSAPRLGSVWFKLTTLLGSVASEVSVSTEGADFDTVLTAYAGQVLPDLVRVATNDDCAAGVSYSCVSFQAGPGVQYSLQVMGAYGEAGSVTVRAWKVT